MMGSIIPTGNVDGLVEVTELNAAFGLRIRREAEARKGSALVEARVGAPIGVIEVKKRLVPGDKAQPRERS